MNGELCVSATPPPPLPHLLPLSLTVCSLIGHIRHVHPAGQKLLVHQELVLLSVGQRRGQPEQTAQHDRGRQQDLRQPKRGVLQVSSTAFKSYSPSPSHHHHHHLVFLHFPSLLSEISSDDVKTCRIQSRGEETNFH